MARSFGPSSRTSAGMVTKFAFDNRGIGRSSAPLPPYTTSQMAPDALELLAHLGWTPETIHLIGVL